MFLLLSAAHAQTTVNRDAVLKATHDCATFLVKACEKDGQIKGLARRNKHPGSTPNPYHVGSHAGTLFALARFERYYPEVETRKALTRATRYFVHEFVAPHRDIPDASVVSMHPRKTQAEGFSRVHLEGTALGLCALAAVDRVLPGIASTNTMRGLGHYFRLMQQEDGSFRPPIDPAHGFDALTTVASHYAGAAALGFLYLDDLTPAPRWTLGSQSALVSLATTRRPGTRSTLDCWSGMATDRLLKHQGERMNPKDRKLLLADIRDVSTRNLKSREQHTSASTLLYEPADDTRTTRSTVKLIGMLSGLRILPIQEQPLRENLRRACDAEICKLLSSQIPEGPYAGAFTHREASKSETEYRLKIESTYYALIALMLYDQITGANWL